jgi:hypothetical protein
MPRVLARASVMWLLVASSASIAQTVTEWQAERKETLRLVLDCYEQQTFRSIKVRLSRDEHSDVVLKICRRPLTSLAHSIIGEFVAAGDAVEVARQKSVLLMTQTHEKALVLYDEMLMVRERQLKDRSRRAE